MAIVANIKRFLFQLRDSSTKHLKLVPSLVGISSACPELPSHPLQLGSLMSRIERRLLAAHALGSAGPSDKCPSATVWEGSEILGCIYTKQLGKDLLLRQHLRFSGLTDYKGLGMLRLQLLLTKSIREMRKVCRVWARPFLRQVSWNSCHLQSFKLFWLEEGTGC